MSIASVNLLKERVLRAAIACVEELENYPGPVVHTKATRALFRAVKAFEAEAWRADEAPALVKELQAYIRGNYDDSPTNVERRAVLLRKAEAFLGEREVHDDTTPQSVPKKRLPRRLGERA